MASVLMGHVTRYVHLFIYRFGKVITDSEGYMPFLMACLTIGTAFSFVFVVIKLIRKFFF